MEEEKAKIEHSQEHHEANPDPKPDPKPDPEPVKKKKKLVKINWRRLGPTIIIILAIIVIALVLTIVLNGPTISTQEMLNLTYSIETGEARVLNSGTETFQIGNIGLGLGFQTDKLDKEIKGMEPGEEKTITLGPKDAYGEYDESLKFTYNRTEEIERESKINRTQKIPPDFFAQTFEERPILDKTYTLTGAPWDYKVTEITEDSVTLSIETKVGEEIPSGFFTSKVTEITEDTITLRLEGEEDVIPTANGNVEIKFSQDYVYFTLTPEIGAWVELADMPRARVTEIDEEFIHLDANPELAGETIIVKVTLNEKYTAEAPATGTVKKIAGAPTMQIFIMSYCPYGLQMLKGMLPVWKEFQDKANIELRFVSYTMHGQEEEDENYRMICIREEQNSGLIPYLTCFADSGDYESCIRQANIDSEKVEDCMQNRAEDYYKEDQDLNDKYGVEGSPTTVINGKVVEIYPRSPEDIKTALCAAFDTAPSECEKTLSTNNPSPGFGFNEGSSNQSGSC